MAATIATVHVDTTILRSVTCSTLAVLRHGHGLTTPEESAALKAGSDAHAALAVFFRTGSARRAMATFEGLYRDWSEEHLAPDHRLAWFHCGTVLDAWCEAHPLDAMPFLVRDPAMIEVGFAYPLTDDGLCACGHTFDDHAMRDDGLCLLCGGPAACRQPTALVFTGRCDGLVTNAAGEWFVLEHKAQPLDARVLTPSGFVPMGTLHAGDPIIGTDGQTHRVTGVYPQGTLPMYRVRLRDGGETRCSANHWWAGTEAHGRTRLLTTQQIADLPPYQRFHLPRLAPPALAAKPLPLNPYLLGALIGDGYLAGTCTQFSGANPEQIDLVRATLPAGDTIRKAGGANHTWVIKGGQTFHALKRLGLHGTHAWSKFIPELYQHGTAGDRLALLQGLLDTDGNVYKGHLSYTTTSERLAQDVTALVWSLGGQARYRKRSGTKHQAYHVSIRLGDLAPFRLSRKLAGVRVREPHQRVIASIEPIGEAPMRCISVSAPDGCYVTDDYIVTHNTTGQVSPMWLHQWQMDAQVSGYIWAAQQHADVPVVGAYINAIEFSKLPSDPVRKCTKHSVPFVECRAMHAKWDLLIVQRTPEALNAWKHTAIHLGDQYRRLVQGTPELTAEAIALLPMEGTFRRECGWCTFKDWCGAARPPARLGQLYTVEFWRPFEYAMTGVA